jgi:hypothetical protein
MFSGSMGIVGIFLLFLRKIFIKWRNA